MRIQFTGFSSGVSHEVSISQATIALQKLANEIREAKSAAVLGEALVVTFTLEVEDPSTGESVYDISANDPTTRTYYVSNGNLVRSVNGVVSVLARGISSATFATSGRSVYVTLTSSEQVGRKTASAQETGRIALRNFRN
ncbi:MAG: hypothetical protein ACUVRS_07715 [Armatimonadota bacterium]